MGCSSDGQWRSALQSLASAFRVLNTHLIVDIDLIVNIHLIVIVCNSVLPTTTSPAHIQPFNLYSTGPLTNCCPVTMKLGQCCIVQASRSPSHSHVHPLASVRILLGPSLLQA